MSKVQVFDTNGKKVKEITAPKEVFDTPIKEHLIYEAVVNYRANQRRGTAATKTRAMVRGGGRKPWRQKGTGRARAGSTRSPLWRSGGTSFGPQPRDYSYSMPKKAKRLALKSALAAKLADEQLMVLDDLAVHGAQNQGRGSASEQPQAGFSSVRGFPRKQKSDPFIEEYPQSKGCRL